MLSRPWKVIVVCFVHKVVKETNRSSIQSALRDEILDVNGAFVFLFPPYFVSVKKPKVLLFNFNASLFFKSSHFSILNWIV